ncbi:DUF3560 domain-containing protein (plasmid) [Leifsonia sp. ZF2019]|uniref:DUF3560 domain-containing protein n=1 Tax=Leifsonia sp. ZF2019 TaxID=2781978 RepID=UPI001CBB71C9|nr:DUF3560 domain-containing protein [Leifsonia sp. ZF2019]UAJ81721.1 DUF3560 domain-containing protein [Leifsonia sp. ZF2019]
MAELTITHTHAEGTIVHGTSRDDGTGTTLKQHGYRWGRSITAWYKPHTRDRLPDTYRIEGVAAALRTAGHNVELDIDHSFRTAADVEADKAARATDRADALDAKADRKADAATRVDAMHERAVAALPEGGEPIKVGHHSERRHRNAIDKAWRALGASVQADKAATEAARRARIAADATDRRNAPVTVANRIDKLAADIRDYTRKLDGHTRHPRSPYRETIPAATGDYRDRLTRMRAEAENQHAYWTAVRAQQIADGLTTDASRNTIKVGDLVRIKGRDWEAVTKTNAKTLDVQSRHMPFPIRYTYGEVTAHKSTHAV